jgi:hypothetical protein
MKKKTLSLQHNYTIYIYHELPDTRPEFIFTFNNLYYLRIVTPSPLKIPGQFNRPFVTNNSRIPFSLKPRYVTELRCTTTHYLANRLTTTGSLKSTAG